MNENTLYKLLGNYPIIAAVKDDIGLEKYSAGENMMIKAENIWINWT